MGSKKNNIKHRAQLSGKEKNAQELEMRWKVPSEMKMIEIAEKATFNNSLATGREKDDFFLKSVFNTMLDI